jgi:hypothetical protein
MTCVRSRTTLASLYLLAPVIALAPPPATAQDSIPSVIQRTGTLRSSRLRESSGVAVSRSYPGVLWTHNDSDEKPFLYAVNLSGELLAVF